MPLFLQNYIDYNNIVSVNLHCFFIVQVTRLIYNIIFCATVFYFTFKI